MNDSRGFRLSLRLAAHAQGRRPWVARPTPHTRTTKLHQTDQTYPSHPTYQTHPTPVSPSPKPRAPERAACRRFVRPDAHRRLACRARRSSADRRYCRGPRPGFAAAAKWPFASSRFPARARAVVGRFAARAALPWPWPGPRAATTRRPVSRSGARLQGHTSWQMSHPKT